VEGAIDPPKKVPRQKPAHLMCRSRFWGFSAAVACAYLAYTSFRELRVGDFEWDHEWWTVLTWAVWLLLLAGLLTETRCRRERIFFVLVLLNFALGLTFSLWSSAPETTVQRGRELFATLWVLSAIASLTTLARPAASRPSPET
jgi:hypothetical protein